MALIFHKNYVLLYQNPIEGTYKPFPPSNNAYYTNVFAMSVIILTSVYQMTFTQFCEYLHLALKCKQ